MNNNNKAVLPAVVLSSLLVATPTSAALYEFHFTGQYTLLDSNGGFMDQQPISSTLFYDDVSDTGSSIGLIIDNFDTFGATATIYDITLHRQVATNYIVGNMLADWNGNIGIPLSMVWDGTGLFNAIEFGLHVGDVISGTNLKRNGVSIADVGSAIPASDVLGLEQGPAPLAMTTLNTSNLCTPGLDCMGNAFSGGAPFSDDGVAGSPLIDGPFAGLNVNFDIGSGNSLTLISVSEVPIPAAVWLLGSGLAVLLGFTKRKARI
jgi:hypothetical protein